MTPSQVLQNQKRFSDSLIEIFEEWAKEHRLTERSKIDATYNEKTAYNEALDDLLEFLKS